nr:PREDICTED: mucin-15-like [Latimeria chalumnae]|eukprot:XP_005996776.2 PREDICTED: mucin-15-like [Latimeria chalumnae]
MATIIHLLIAFLLFRCTVILSGFSDDMATSPSTLAARSNLSSLNNGSHFEDEAFLGSGFMSEEVNFTDFELVSITPVANVSATMDDGGAILYNINPTEKNGSLYPDVTDGTPALFISSYINPVEQNSSLYPNTKTDGTPLNETASLNIMPTTLNATATSPFNKVFSSTGSMVNSTGQLMSSSSTFLLNGTQVPVTSALLPANSSSIAWSTIARSTATKSTGSDFKWVAGTTGRPITQRRSSTEAIRPKIHPKHFSGSKGQTNGPVTSGKKNVTGKALGMFVGISVGVLLLLALIYIIYTKTAQKDLFSHRRLYEDNSEDPVLRLDSPMDLDDGFMENDLMDYSPSTTGQPVNVQMAPKTLNPRSPASGTPNLQPIQDIIQLEIMSNQTQSRNFI